MLPDTVEQGVKAERDERVDRSQDQRIVDTIKNRSHKQGMKSFDLNMSNFFPKTLFL